MCRGEAGAEGGGGGGRGSEDAVPLPIVQSRRKDVCTGYGIFKALGKKNGSRK